MSHHATCFLCGAHVTPADFLSESTAHGVVTRRYECSICAAVHEVSGYATHAGSTGVRPKELLVSRRQAAGEMDDLASAVANLCGVPVPMNFLADLSQALGEWAEGSLPEGLAEEYQRIRDIDARYRVTQ